MLINDVIAVIAQNGHITHLHYVKEGILTDFQQNKNETNADKILNKVLYYTNGLLTNLSLVELKPFLIRKNKSNIKQICVLWRYHLFDQKSFRNKF